MDSTKIIVFDVEHGFCGAIIDSSNNILLLDCGRKSYFSPLKYMTQYFNVPLNNLDIGLFILSHPHGDHIQDVDNLLISNVRNRLTLPINNFTGQELRDGNTSEGYANIQKFESSYSHFTSEGYNPPPWLFNFDYYSLTVAESKRIDSGQVINNSSKVVIIEFADKKILFCGDVQKSGWDMLLNSQDFIAAAMHPSVIVTPHHGHRSSYTSALYDAIGKPVFNICSLASNDPHLAQEYSSDETSIGTPLYGRNRRMLSTRSDGSIFIDLYEKEWNVGFEHISDNE